MKIGDLMRFHKNLSYLWEDCADRLFTIIKINNKEQSVCIMFLDNGWREHWDKTTLLHESKKIKTDKKCP